MRTPTRAKLIRPARVGGVGFVFLCLALAVFALTLGVAPAHAGAPKPWGFGFQEPASPFAERVNAFHNFLLVVIGLISLFVTGLLAFVMLRFNERANPVPSRTTHNTRLEVVWTIGPILILVLIAIFSFPLLYFGDTVPDSKYTVKVTGHQWYWSYEYETPEGEVFAFDSLLLSDEDAVAQGKPRLLAVDEPMMLPVGTPVRFVVTASDVLHAFAVPAFAIKTDAVPGRLNETWAEVLRPGTYYGQCSELCGTGHAYMPIMIEAVSEAEFLSWLRQGPARFAGAPADNAAPSLVAPASDKVQVAQVEELFAPQSASNSKQ